MQRSLTRRCTSTPWAAGWYPAAHLSTLAQRLPALQFLRCHKSYLVNLSHAVGLRRYCFRLTDGSSVPVSKKNYTQVQQSFLHYCEENLGLR